MCRVIFIRDYTLKSLRLKQDKWNKLVLSDEQRCLLNNFIEKGLIDTLKICRKIQKYSPHFTPDSPGVQQVLVISQNIGGQLQVRISSML